MSTIAQRSFAGGELSPAIFARPDTIKYQSGAKTLRNMMVMKHGGLTNRPGLTYIAEAKDSTKDTRLLPFVFSNDQTYALEFGDQYMRVHRNGMQLTESAKTITAITLANPAVITITAHGYTTGQEVYLSVPSGPTGIHGRNVKVTVLTANTFSIQDLQGNNISTVGMAAYTSGAQAYRVYEIATPYLSTDLKDVQFIQSADVVFLVHPSYAARKLSRLGHTNWTLSVISFVPQISSPVIASAIYSGTAGSKSYKYIATRVDKKTLEESLPSAIVTVNSASDLTASNFVTLTIQAAAIPPPSTGEIFQYVVYKESNGIYGFCGIAESTAFDTSASFKDIGFTPTISDTAPSDRNPFTGTGNYPSFVALVQQRLAMGGSNNEPEKIYMSRTAKFYNFTTSSPIKADDSISFTMAGRQVNRVRHMVDIGLPLTFTSGGEFGVMGDSSGVITPTTINPKQYTYNGSSTIAPIVIGNTALYIQARGSVIRDLAFNQESDGYQGSDLTIFSSHLFEGFSVVSWCYQQTPNSIVWAVRNDGILLGFTYLKEQQIWGWHRHDTEGFVESVISIPEGDSDVVYMVVKRLINGAYRRYIERMNSRIVFDIVDAKFMDSSLSYDGRNTNASSLLTLSGSGWTYNDTLTLTASLAGTFKASDVGNEIHFYSSNYDDFVKLRITAFTSGTVVSVKPDKTVPVVFRNVANNNYAKAVDELSGLHHLEGQLVSIFADGYVVSNPNNNTYTIRQVVNGQVALDKCYAVIHVGLPYTSDFQSLDVDFPQGPIQADKIMIVNKVSIKLEQSRGVFAGQSFPTGDNPIENLQEMKPRNSERWDEPAALKSQTVSLNIQSRANNSGSIVIRQVDPLPLTILAIFPAGSFSRG